MCFANIFPFFNIFINNTIIEFSKFFQTPLKHEQYFASIGNWCPEGLSDFSKVNG